MDDAHIDMHKTCSIRPERLLDAAPAALPRIHLCRLVRLADWQAADLSAPWWRLYLPLDPGTAITWRGRRVPLLPGEALLIAPGTAFAATCTAPFRKAYAHFTWQVTGRTALPGVHRQRVGLATVRAVAACGDATAFAGHMLAVLGAACAALPADAFASARQPGALVRQAQALLAGDGPPPANSAVAARLGLHPHSLGRLFASELGCAPQAWAREQRLLRAAELLAGTSQDIDLIAAQCGCWDRNHFTRLFTRRWQCPPARFRNRERTAQE